MGKIKIKLLPNLFSEDGKTYKMKDALLLSGKIGGMCYLQGDFSSIEGEEERKTVRRIVNTIANGHHSVYDHLYINMEIEGLPKIVAMMLNNEKMYTTSEKSARYTHLDESVGLSERELELYNKWCEILHPLIKDELKDKTDDKKAMKLAQENARYMVSVFMPTKMAYSTSLRQINYLYHFFEDYINNAKTENELKIARSLRDFNEALVKANVVVTNLKDIFPDVNDGIVIKDTKNRKQSLMVDKIEDEEVFSNIYSFNYKASLAYLAQAQRHRTLNYKMILENTHEFYVPPILNEHEDLVKEWIKDIDSVSDLLPQGMLVKINENGMYQDFILKCEERLCTFAQLEINDVTRDLLYRYSDKLIEKSHALSADVKKYLHGSRCTFPCYNCISPCNNVKGVTQKRKI